MQQHANIAAAAASFSDQPLSVSASQLIAYTFGAARSEDPSTRSADPMCRNAQTSACLRSVHSTGRRNT